MEPFEIIDDYSCYGWKWHFLAKKHHAKLKNIHNYSAKTYDILITWNVFESLWSGFVVYVKQLFFSVLGMAHGDPFFGKVRPKNGSF